MKINLIDENLTGQDGLSMFLNPELGWGRNDNIENYDVIIYTDRKCFNSEINPSKKNYAWIIEPPIVNGENYKYIVENQDKFEKVFSYNINLESQLKNFQYIFHGGTWLRESDIQLHPKTKNVSFIYSDKLWNSGHRYRHFLVDQIKDGYGVDFYGSGSNNPIKYKIEALMDYRFSIVVENSVENDYFTEKILDCFLSGVIPIYLGTKNINKYFNINGILQFNDEVQLKEILKSLNDDLYNSKLEFIKENFKLSKNYIFPEKHINNFIKIK